jgi:hypothetical protein
MATSRSESIVLVLDCCQSGAFIEGRTPKGDREVHVEDHFEDAGTGRITLSASTALEAQTAPEDIGSASPGSLFTKHFVEGLETPDADLDLDGRVSIDEAFRYLERKLQSEFPKQTPGRGGQNFGPIFIAHGRRT